MDVFAILTAMLQGALAGAFGALQWLTLSHLVFVLPVGIALAWWSRWQSTAIIPSLIYRWL